MNDWQRLIADYGAMVYTAAWRVLRHRQDVEDVVQEVFIQAWQARNQYEVAHWRGSLRQVAVCRALDRLNSRRATAELIPDCVDSGDQPANAVEAAELQQRLRLAVAELPERERLVFSLRISNCCRMSQLPRYCRSVRLPSPPR